MKQLAIGDIISRAWDLAVKHWPIFVLIVFINFLLSQGMLSVDADTLTAAVQSNDPQVVMQAYMESISFNPILGTICFLLSLLLSFTLLVLYRTTIVEGKPYQSFGDILKVDPTRLLTYVGVYLVYNIVVGIGVCLCILPGIFLGVRLWYAPLIAATENVSFSEAFSRSWEATKGNFWNLFLMGLAIFGIAILGVCACCVGLLFAEVIAGFMVVLSYLALTDADATADSTTDYVEVQ